MNGTQYTKRVSNQLSISLKYIKNENENECIVGFTNLSKQTVKVNPKESDPNGAHPSANGSKPVGTNWLTSVFGGGGENRSSLESETERLSLESQNQTVNVFLGNIQLLGYVICNYKVNINDGNLDHGTAKLKEEREDSDIYEEQTNNEFTANEMNLWNNKEYVELYNNDDLDDVITHTGWDSELKIEEILDTAPFIQQSYKDRMIIGGKVGGINDLVVDDGKKTHNVQNTSAAGSGEGSKFQVDKYKRYLLQDLFGGGFNSLPEPKGKVGPNGVIDGTDFIKDISEIVLPFYTSSQSLLFSDLQIKAGETKSFHVKFPKVVDSPPSYNTHSTGITGDQGLISIRYSVAIGLSEMSLNSLQQRTVYFPHEVKAEYLNDDESYLLPDYLQRVKIDTKWEASLIDGKEKDPKMVLASKPTEKDHSLDKQSFLDDLTELIDSDLYNMPKISTTERRKSIHIVNERNDGLVPQLTKHLKTQYQIRLNSEQLCMVSISKPYYHVGDDINFIIDTTNIGNATNTTKIVGSICHLEAHEIFHCKSGKQQTDKDFVNIYKVSPTLKISSYASAMTSNENKSTSSTLIHGSINVPRYLTTQFQSSRLVNLQYFLSLKFTLNEFDDAESKAKRHLSNENLNHDVNNGNAEVHEENQTLITDAIEGIADSTSPATNPYSKLGKFRKYQIESNGSEFKFKLPIILL